MHLRHPQHRTTTRPEPAAGRIVGARYRLVKPLASGGMGSLWVARHIELDVDVALKLMSDKLVEQPEARARFTREARMLAGLRSAHLVHVQDFGLDEGMPFLVMELLHGEDLGSRLDRVLRLDLGETQRLLAQLAKGLRRAHDAGLVHRDLKPSNVFLALVDGEETAKLVDFGAAKDLVGQEIGEGTRTGEVLGSPRYMSPEHMRGAKNLDQRADLWSLAVILYRALTGILPFDAEEVGALVAQVLTDPIPPPSAVTLDLPESLDLFFFRALAREPDARFQSVREMARAFDEAIAEATSGKAERVVVGAGSEVIGGEATALAAPTIGAELTAAASPLARRASITNEAGRGSITSEAGIAPAPSESALVSAPDATIAGKPARSGRVASAALGAIAGLALGLGLASTSRREAPAPPASIAASAPRAPEPAAAATVTAAAPIERTTAAPIESAAPATSAAVDRPAAIPGPAKSEWGFRQWGF